MKPDWDKLGTEFANSKSAVIVDVDCTKEQSLCGKYGVKGYPTIKYFDGSSAEGTDYKGGRSYDDLKKFVEENLASTCSNDDREGCSDEQIKLLDEAAGMSAEDRAAEVAKLQKEQADAQTKFETSLKELQNTYEQLQADLKASKDSVGPRLRIFSTFDKNAKGKDEL